MAEEKKSNKKIIWFIIIATIFVVIANIVEKPAQTTPKIDEIDDVIGEDEELTNNYHD